MVPQAVVMTPRTQAMAELPVTREVSEALGTPAQKTGSTLAPWAGQPTRKHR
jgi:hypothetical protein